MPTQRTKVYLLVSTRPSDRIRNNSADTVNGSVSSKFSVSSISKLLGELQQAGITNFQELDKIINKYMDSFKLSVFFFRFVVLLGVTHPCLGEVSYLPLCGGILCERRSLKRRPSFLD